MPRLRPGGLPVAGCCGFSVLRNAPPRASFVRTAALAEGLGRREPCGREFARSRDMAIKRVLVPVDFSAPSLQALDYAVDFARPLDAEIVVLFVVEPIYSVTPGDLYAPSSELTVLMQEQRRQGREQLVETEARLKKRYPKVRTVLEDGLAYQAIVAAADKLKADLIVMATHGRTGLSHLFMGSVAEKVVRTAGCPVLTVRVSQGRKTRRTKRTR